MRAIRMRGGMGRTFLIILSCFLHSSSVFRTALWGETTEITKDVPIGKVKGWRCSHCDAESWNRNAARLQFHQSGYADLRDAENGFCGVDVFKKVPDARCSSSTY